MFYTEDNSNFRNEMFTKHVFVLTESWTSPISTGNVPLYSQI